MKNAKYYLNIPLFIAIFLTIPLNSHASSGACSSHGGVNTAVEPSINGTVVCNDGWQDSSVPYTPPNCAAVTEQQVINGTSRYAPQIAQGAVTNCQNQVNQYDAVQPELNSQYTYTPNKTTSNFIQQLNSNLQNEQSSLNTEKTNLESINNIASSTNPVKPQKNIEIIDTNIGIGDSGINVERLQAVLLYEGLLASSTPAGHFGNITKLAVKKFQANNNLPVTGYCGTLTRSLLNRIFIKIQSN